MTRISALVLAVAVLMAGPCLSFVTPPPVLSHKSCASTSRATRPCVRRATAPTTAAAVAVAALGKSRSSATGLGASEDGGGETVAPQEPVAPIPPVDPTSNLPFYLDPSTRGGAVVIPTLSLLVPLGAYGLLTSLGVAGSKAGAWVGVGYTMIGLIAWVGSYFFRVATKNMTYAVQLKNYEQAVIEKRFSELEEEEVDALLDEVNET